MYAYETLHFYARCFPIVLCIFLHAIYISDTFYYLHMYDQRYLEVYKYCYMRLDILIAVSGITRLTFKRFSKVIDVIGSLVDSCDVTVAITTFENLKGSEKLSA